MNLYLDRRVVALLDKIAGQKNTSRSQSVEQIVREYHNTYGERDEFDSVPTPNSLIAKRADKAQADAVRKIRRKPNT